MTYDAYGDGAEWGARKTLRDEMAMAVDISAYKPANTFLKNHGRNASIEELADYIAVIRYFEADAMMKARG